MILTTGIASDMVVLNFTLGKFRLTTRTKTKFSAKRLWDMLVLVANSFSV